MKDISDDFSTDIEIVNTHGHKAKNLLSVQLGSLEYAKDIGIDFEFFFQEGIKIQNASFQAYCIELLCQNSINVGSLIEENDSLFTSFIFNLEREDDTTSFLTR